MSMRHLIVLSSLCLALVPARAVAQQRGTVGGVVATEEVRQNLLNMARELERAQNLERRAAGLEQGGGGRGGRTGGLPPQTTFDPRTNDPMSAPVVPNAPFSADANTTVTQTLGDGTNLSQRASAKFYRDGTGRIRREQTIIGMDWANPAAPGQPMTVVTIDSEPGDPRPLQLDAATRTARRVTRANASSPGANINVTMTLQAAQLVFGGNEPRIAGLQTGQLRTDQVDMPVNFQGLMIPRRGIPSGLRPAEEQLGTRQIEGLKATGVRTTVTIPIDRVGNDRPIQITDERWTSPELGLVVYSRYSDPRTGVVEYRLTNINRSEPRADLFVVPPDYTITGDGRGGGRSGGPAPPAPQSPDTLSPRGGGAGGRGQRQGGPPQQ